MNETDGLKNSVNERYPLRMLLIEDSDTDAYIIQKAVGRYLKHARCHRVSTLKEGEEHLQSGKINIVLLDLGLPDTASPADTYEQIKKWADKVPVIILTQIHDHELARIMVQEGAADFMNKDAVVKDPERAMEAVDLSLDRHRLRRELLSDKERALRESREKDSVLNCFMGGYSILK
jgi:DNA-binding NtrC family response regulator